MRALRKAWNLVWQSIQDFLSDDALSLAGALAFYSALSLAPLLIIFLSVASLLGPGGQEQLVRQIESLIGPHATPAMAMIIESSADRPKLGTFAGIVGFIVLFFSASGAFGQLQASLNRIWNVRAKPHAGIWSWLRKRLLSMGLVLTVGFLLIVSLVVSTLLGLLFPTTGILWQCLSALVSLGVFVLLFAAMFKYLPDVRMGWRNVWFGAALTGILFVVGKLLIGLYLGHSSVGSSYGAAGSLIVVLLWVYYAAAILFLGAELTQARAREAGSPIEPTDHAEWEPEARDAPRKEAPRPAGAATAGTADRRKVPA